MRLYDIGGFPVKLQFAVNDFTTDGKYLPRPSLSDNGSFVVAWTSGSNYTFDVKARKTAVRAAPAIEMDPNEPISSPAGGSGLGNGVFEPGETQILRTAWVNDSAADVLSVAGSAPLFTGPPGADYTLNDDTALYDTIPAGNTKSRIVSGDCYSVTVSDPAVRPVQHWDALLQESFSLSLPHTWVLHIGESFPDVAADHPFYRFIETLFHTGVTTGCAAYSIARLSRHPRPDGRLPPDGEVRRGPRPPAVHGDRLHRRALHGRTVPSLDRGARRGVITGGCGGGNYCPGDTVTREQMAVFLLKAREGSTYVPPCARGVYDDVPARPAPSSPTGSRNSPTAASPAAAPWRRPSTARPTPTTAARWPSSSSRHSGWSSTEADPRDRFPSTPCNATRGQGTRGQNPRRSDEETRPGTPSPRLCIARPGAVPVLLPEFKVNTSDAGSTIQRRRRDREKRRLHRDLERVRSARRDRRPALR